MATAVRMVVDTHKGPRGGRVVVAAATRGAATGDAVAGFVAGAGAAAVLRRLVQARSAWTARA